MLNPVEAFLTEAGRNFQTRSYLFTGRPDNLDELEKLFDWMQKLGQAGHTASAKVFVDGDGAGYVKVSRNDGTQLRQGTYDENSNGSELRIDID